MTNGVPCCLQVDFLMQVHMTMWGSYVQPGTNAYGSYYMTPGSHQVGSCPPAACSPPPAAGRPHPAAALATLRHINPNLHTPRQTLLQDIDTPLAPFQKPGTTGFFTSADVKDTTAFGWVAASQ